MKKTITKLILLLALMLFGAGGASWAQTHQKYTGPVDIADLQVGDTLAPGFSLTCSGGSITINGGTHKFDGNVMNDNTIYNCSSINSYLSFGPDVAINFTYNNATNISTPWDGTQDGNAWLVTNRSANNGVYLSGIYISDPYEPAKDANGNWSFLMPGANKILSVEYLDSIVLGPHVSLGQYSWASSPATLNSYTRSDSTILYYEPGTLASVTLAAAETDGNGRFFAYWDDLPSTNPYYNNPSRYVYSTEIVCGHRYVAVYPDPYTLTLKTDTEMGTIFPADGQAYVTALTDSTYSVIDGSRVAIVATPNAGFHLEGWSNDNGTPDTIYVTMTSDSTVTVTFDTTKAELAWDTNAFTGYAMIDFNAWKPTLANPNEVEVRYGVVDNAIDINATTGIIGTESTGDMPGYIVILPGTFTVYAVHDLTQEYFYDSVTYTLTVEQGALVSLQKNLAEGGEVSFSTFDAEPTLTASYDTINTNTGIFAHGTEIGILAEPATGYHFTGWEVKSVTAPIVTIPTFQALTEDAAYTYTVPEATAVYLRANFDTNVYNVTYTVQNDSREEIGTNLPMGSVSLGGRHMHFLNDTLTVTAAHGYTFSGWYANNELVSDADTFVFNPVSDTAFEARFSVNQYAVSGQPQGSHIGSVNGNATVDYLENVTLNAVPGTGYHFVNWTDTLGNVLGIATALTIETVSDSMVYAVFDTNHYNLVARVMANCNGCGTATGSEIEARHFVDYTLTAEATPCYHFVNWTDTLGNEVSTSETLTISPVSDSVLVAHFELNSYTGDTTVIVCDSFAWHGTTYTETPATAPTYTYKNANNCDSVVTLNLTIRHSTNSDTAAVVCDSMNWYEHLNITESGSLTHIFAGSNDAGCDSIVTLNLTINTSIEESIVETVCVSYLWDGTPYTESGVYSKSYEALNGCDSTVYLTLTVNQPTTAIDTVTACDSHEWHGTTYTSSTSTPNYTSTGSNGCDSTTYLHLTVNNSVATSFTDSACIFYIWDGFYYNQEGTHDYIKHYTAVNGCDSTVTLTLTVNQPVTTAISESVCDSYTWNDVEYAASGVYTQSFEAQNGCDSTVTLTLTVRLPKIATITASECGSYLWHGTNYTTSGNYTYTTEGSNGCDSTTTLLLTINNPVHTSESMVACGSYTWHNTAYTVSGNYTYSHADNNGCTQVDTLHLTINTPVHETETAVACESYIWHGIAYAASGDYTYSHTDNNGCTQVDTLHLTVNQPVTTAISESVCDSYTWNNVEYAASGVYTQAFEAQNGCDSTVTLTLIVRLSKTATITASECGSYLWHGTNYTTGGNYTYTTQGSNGCDSTTTLLLTINNPVHTSESMVACGSYTWHNTAYTVSDNYTYSHADNNGCTQVDTLHLTINTPAHEAETAVACESYIWHGIAYAVSGDYTYSHTDNNGCTQVDTLHLTVNSPVYTSETVAACESYAWNGTVYTVSGNYTYTTEASNNCDSVVTLHLTINNPVHTSESMVACESYTWHGTAYTVSGNYTYSHADNNGCTQVDTLHLTIGNSVTVEDTANACDSYEWNGRTYTESGVYTYNSTTSAGCDSTVTLTLTVNHSTASSFDTLAYSSFTWNNETYTESGTYEQTLTTVTGCDSVVTLNLVILPEGFVMPYLYNLMNVMLSVNHNEAGTENVHYVWYRWYRNGVLVFEGPDYDSYSENGNILNGCYYLEVAVDESMQYWVRSNEVCIGNVGIEEAESIEVTLAPNPVMHGSMVSVSVDGADLQGAEIRLYDLQGRQVFQQKDNGIIEVPQTAGVYMVRLTLADSRTVVKRLIVK